MIVRRSKSTQSKVVASLVAAALLASCAPKAQAPKTYAPARMVFTTSMQDQKLAVRDAKPEELLNQISATQQMKTSELFRSVSGLYLLAGTHNSPTLRTLADGIDNQFYTSLNTTAKVRFEQSPIVQAALGYGKEYSDLAKNILDLIEGSVGSYPWPAKIKFKNYEVESQKYVSWLIEQVRAELKKKNIEISDEEIAKGEAEILKLLETRQDDLATAIASIKDAESAEMMLSSATDFIDTLMLDLTTAPLANLSKQMTVATELGPKIDAIADKATAGKALDEAKKVMTAQELKSIDETSAPEQLKALLLKALGTSVVNKIEVAAATQSFPQLPNQLLTLLSMGVIGLEVEQIKAIATNPKVELKKMAVTLGESHLLSAPAGITGIESAEIDVVLQSSNLKISGKATKEIVTSAEAIGASLSNSIAKLIEADKQEKTPEKQKEMNALAVSQLNKLVLMGGFKTEDNTIASYTAVQDSKKTPVEILVGAPNTVSAVSDELTIARNLTPTSRKNDVSVRGQASLLQGLSDTIAYLRDWKKSGFDKGLGQLTIAAALGSDATEGLLATKLFDKSLMFTLAIGNAATVLENSTKELTPFFLMGTHESPQWLNQLPLKDKEGNAIRDARATAGVVDIVNGKRNSVTKVGDVARYVLALSNFLKATDGIEKTKSGLLKAVDENGNSKLDKLVEARAKLRVLLSALANMLSGKLQQADGSFAEKFNKDTGKVAGKASAVDTALAIEALVKVSEEFNAGVYATAALEAYFAMNRDLFNKDLQFYTQDAKAKQVPSYSGLVSILNSINTLKDHMPRESQQQWESVASNWVGALELLAKNLEAAKK